MPTRSQAIAALKAKLDARKAPDFGPVEGARAGVIEALGGMFATPEARPVLSEGAAHRIELASTETVVNGKLRRIVDDAPLGRGFSFQLPGRRLFVYERDLRPGPDGCLTVMA